MESNDVYYISLKGYYWAKKINYRKGILKNSLRLFEAKLDLDTVTAAFYEQKMKIFLNKSERINDIETEILCYINLGYYNSFNFNNLEKGKLYLKKALEISLKYGVSKAPLVLFCSVIKLSTISCYK